jgi:hypothetical protein
MAKEPFDNSHLEKALSTEGIDFQLVNKNDEIVKDPISSPQPNPNTKNTTSPVDSTSGSKITPESAAEKVTEPIITGDNSVTPPEDKGVDASAQQSTTPSGVQLQQNKVQGNNGSEDQGKKPPTGNNNGKVPPLKGKSGELPDIPVDPALKELHRIITEQ